MTMKPTAASGMLAPDDTSAPARRLPPPPVFTPPTGMGVLLVGVGVGDGDGVSDGDVVAAGVVLGVGVDVLVGVGVPVMDRLGDGDGKWHPHGQ
jgi:hypothetical protein